MIKAKRIFLLFLALLAPVSSHGAESPFEIDLKELERPGSATAPKADRENRRSEKTSRKRSERTSHRGVVKGGSDGYLRYTVQPGDHIFKILTGRFGMTNEAAERLVPNIIRINRIGDIKNLTVGETLLIPNREKRAAIAAKEEAVKPTAAVPAAKGDARRGLPPIEMPAPAPATLPAPAIPQPAPVTQPTSPATQPTASATPPPGTPSAASLATTWICPVPERDPAAAVDSLLALLEAAVSRDKTLKAGQGADTSLAVEVARYFEYQGGRYIVSIGESDPGRYTLLRILETAGYKVLRLDGKEEFRDTGEKLLRLVGVEPDFGGHPLQQGKAVTGFLIKQEGPMGRRVVVSAEPSRPGERWVLAPECGAR